MKSDDSIINEGFNALLKHLNLVEVERFIALINRGKYDYTQWRKNLWEDMTVEELSSKAMDYHKKNNK